MFKIWHLEYKNAGLEKIKVHANIDVGGYTWAKYGFSPNNSDDMRFIINKANRLFEEGTLTDKQYAHFNLVKENANDGIIDLNKIANADYGKSLLLKTDWSGEINLNDKKRVEIYENYLFGK
jgi:hypothetical protein